MEDRNDINCDVCMLHNAAKTTLDMYLPIVTSAMNNNNHQTHSLTTTIPASEQIRECAEYSAKRPPLCVATYSSTAVETPERNLNFTHGSHFGLDRICLGVERFFFFDDGLGCFGSWQMHRFS